MLTSALRRLFPRWSDASGRRGERVAARHLKRAGYRILGRNVRLRQGEIDLLAEAPDRRTIVIVEVKSGASDAVAPEHHVNAAKQRKLTALAAELARRRRFSARPMRFDVVAVVLPPHDRKREVVRHHVGAFEARM